MHELPLKLQGKELYQQLLLDNDISSAEKDGQCLDLLLKAVSNSVGL